MLSFSSFSMSKMSASLSVERGAGFSVGEGEIDLLGGNGAAGVCGAAICGFSKTRKVVRLIRISEVTQIPLLCRTRPSIRRNPCFSSQPDSAGKGISGQYLRHTDKYAFLILFAIPKGIG